MKKRNVYYFDNTIYNGNCSIDFYFFCLGRKPIIIKYFPSIIYAIILYILNIKDKKHLEIKFFQFATIFDNLDYIVELFWEKNSKKIKDWYLKQKKNNDLVVSNSPEFLLSYICDKLKLDLIATNFVIKNNTISSEVYNGIEKCNVIFSNYKNIKILELYINSLDNNYLTSIAEKSYIVNKNNLIALNQYKESFFEKLKKIFFARDFLMFLVIGVVNTIDVIWMSLLYSLIMKDSIAFIFGWMTSLIVAYSLNSIFNYKEKLELKKLLSFTISNIPNFFIQNLTAIVILDMLHWDKLLAYFISAIIGVPVTFVCIKLFVFNKHNHKKMIVVE